MEQTPEQLTQITSLISKIHASTAAFLKTELKNRGLPELVSSHGNILFQLSRHDKMTMTEITAAIHRDKSTTTALIKKLEKEGYVERLTNPEDSRVTWICLTARGQEYTTATSDISRLLTDRACDGFSDEEKQTVYRLLERISTNFE